MSSLLLTVRFPDATVPLKIVKAKKTCLTSSCGQVVDFFRHGPPEIAKKLSAVNSAARLGFALSFILLRMIIWPMISALFWYDVGGIFLAGGDGIQKPTTAVLFLLSNAGLTTLQLIWGKKVIKALTDVIAGGKKEKKEKQ